MSSLHFKVLIKDKLIIFSDTKQEKVDENSKKKSRRALSIDS